MIKIRKSMVINLSLIVFYCMGVAACANFITERSDVSKVYSHMERVRVAARQMHEKFSCYPTSADSFSNPNTFKSSVGNSCNTYLSDNKEMKTVRFTGDVSVRDGVFHVLIDDLKFEGVIEQSANRNIVYKVRGLKKRNQDITHLTCQLYNRGTAGLKGNLVIYNEEIVSDENPCGMDNDNNPIVYIGKSSPLV